MECSECGKQFEAQRSTARFCGPTCRQRAGRADEDDPKAMYARAKRLEKINRDARGLIDWVGVDGKTVKVPGPVVRTGEVEARAEEILRLRRKAAKIENPTERDQRLGAVAVVVEPDHPDTEAEIQKIIAEGGSRVYATLLARQRLAKRK